MSLTPEQCEQFWTYADADGDDGLTIHELKAGLHKFLGEKNQGGEVKCIPDSVIVEIFTDHDKDGNISISKEEFLQEMMLPHRRENHNHGNFYRSRQRRKQEHLEGIVLARNDAATPKTLKAEFMQLCNPVTKKMGRAEVAKMCQAKKTYSDEDIAKILQEADKNGDGQIDLDEFLAACS